MSLIIIQEHPVIYLSLFEIAKDKYGTGGLGETIYDRL